MDDDWIPLIESYGPAGVMVINFLSCLGFPIPALVVMIIAGAWAATAGAPLAPYLILGYVGALVPGIVVFALGRRYGAAAVARMEGRRGWGRLIASAHARHEKWGGAAIFLGSSFAAQAGPAINLLAGAAEVSWRQFHVSHFAGRAIWVGGYTLIGFAFADNIDAVIAAAARWSWVIAAVVLTLGAVVLFRVLRNGR
jgi:membrane protein DedA with SNARE-associated domain